MGHKRGCNIVLQPSHSKVTAVSNLWNQHMLQFSKVLNGKTQLRIFSVIAMKCNPYDALYFELTVRLIFL